MNYNNFTAEQMDERACPDVETMVICAKPKTYGANTAEHRIVAELEYDAFCKELDADMRKYRPAILDDIEVLYRVEYKENDEWHLLDESDNLDLMVHIFDEASESHVGHGLRITNALGETLAYTNRAS